MSVFIRAFGSRSSACIQRMAPLSRAFATVVTPANEIDKGSIIKQKWKEDGPAEYWEINNVRQVKQGRQAAHVSVIGLVLILVTMM